MKTFLGRLFLSALGAIAVAGAASFSSPNVTAATLSINLAQCCPPDQAYGMYAHGFGERLAKNSNGAMDVKNLDGGVMGDEQVMAQKVQIGTLHMAAVTSNNVAQFAPSANVLVLPYLNSSPADLLGPDGLLRPGPYLDELNRRILKESGSVRIIGAFTNDFRKLFTKDRCVQTLADLQGLKIRMPKNPVMEELWKAWGVSTYPIAWSETFGAIQQGVVDAFDSPLDVIPKMGFYKYIKYVIDTKYLPQAAFLIVNERWFQKLSTEDRELILKTAAENDQWHYEWVEAQQKSIRSALESEHGVKFCKLTDAAEWESKARATWPALYPLVGGGKDWVDATLKYKETGKFSD